MILFRFCAYVNVKSQQLFKKNVTRVCGSEKCQKGVTYYLKSSVFNWFASEMFVIQSILTHIAYYIICYFLRKKFPGQCSKNFFDKLQHFLN